MGQSQSTIQISIKQVSFDSLFLSSPVINFVINQLAHINVSVFAIVM